MTEEGMEVVSTGGAGREEWLGEGHGREGRLVRRESTFDRRKAVSMKVN